MSQMFSQNPEGASQWGGGAPKHEFMLPCTVAMCNKITQADDVMLIGNRNVTFASYVLVGQVTNVDKNDQNTKYTLQDCTGEIQVTIWNNQEGQDQREDIPEATYAKVMGRVRMFNGSPSINGYNIMKIGHYDEVTQHYLSVCHSWLETEKIAGTTGGGAPGIAAQTAAPGHTAGGQVDFGSGGGGDDEALAGASESVKQVYKLILQNQNTSEDGANLMEISKQLGRDISADVEYLMNEGQVYDTVSENFVKPTS